MIFVVVRKKNTRFRVIIKRIVILGKNLVMHIAPAVQIILMMLISMGGNAQMRLDEIDTGRIGQEKICEYIEWQQETGIETVADIAPSLSANSSVKGYRVRENVYILKHRLQEVWQQYIFTNPSRAWNSKRVSVGFVITKDQNIAYYNDDITRIDTGMVVYINIKIAHGLKSLATAFEFTKIDPENKIIEFSYIKGNGSVGKQRLSFFETANGFTRIVHTSYYKSSHLFRNYLLYSYFHTRLTNEFHRNMKKIMAEN